MGSKKFWELTNDVLAGLELPFDVGIKLVIDTLGKTAAPESLKGGLGGWGAEGFPSALFVIAAFCLAVLVVWGVALSLTALALSHNWGIRSFITTGLFVFLIPVLFNGLKVALCGTVAVLGLKVLALYEIRWHSKGANTPLREEALAYDMQDRKSLLLSLLNLGAIFPLTSWGLNIDDSADELRSAIRRRAEEGRILYQNLWFSRSYKKGWRGVKRFFESPVKTRRYVYLTFKWEAGKSLAWFGLPFKEHPQFKLRSALFGSWLVRAFGLALGVLNFAGATTFTSYLTAQLRPAARTAGGLWNSRPSLVYSLISRFQPGGSSASGSLDGQPRFVNLATDMEVFGSRGSNLLVFTFLVWSFLARVLLVMCLLGLF